MKRYCAVQHTTKLSGVEMKYRILFKQDQTTLLRFINCISNENIICSWLSNLLNNFIFNLMIDIWFWCINNDSYFFLNETFEILSNVWPHQHSSICLNFWISNVRSWIILRIINLFLTLLLRAWTGIRRWTILFCKF